MNERPTPEEIACRYMQESGMSRIMQDVIEELGHYGFVIVHPDDHPRSPTEAGSSGLGWESLWDRIFGNDQ